MAINSRRKGNRAMNAIAKSFQRWWGGEWQRRGGGFAGDDIIPPDGFPYSLEVKDVAQIKVRHFVQPTSLLLEYWKQAKTQAVRIGKITLLVIKTEGLWFVARITNGQNVKSRTGLWSVWGDDPVLILPLDEFFEHAKKKDPESN